MQEAKAIADLLVHELVYNNYVRSTSARQANLRREWSAAESSVIA